MVNVGLMGTGLMGLPLGQRLLQAGIPLTAYNRTAAKLTPLAAAGAAIAPTPTEVLAASEVIILMLSNAEAIQSLLFSPGSSLQNRTIVQMSTIAPAESIAIRDQVVAAGGDYLEVPVLGSIPEAQSGTLILMVGAEPEQFERWQDLLRHFGPAPRLIGPVGTAAALKLAMNQLIGSLTTAFALSLGLVMRHNVDVETFMEVVRSSALYAPTFDKKLQRMLERNYANPNFPTKHLLKDMTLCLETAAADGLRVDALAGVQAILESALALHLGDADYSALFSAVTPQE